MFWERFYTLCILKNIRPSKVACLLGIRYSEVLKWKKGEYPNSDESLKLADFFNVPAEYLSRKKERELPHNLLYTDNYTRVEVPVYGKITSGLEAYTNDQIQSYMTFNLDSINYECDYMCLIVDNNCMHPIINEFDVILVQITPKASSGSCAIIAIDGTKCVMRNIYYTSTAVELRSFNPSCKVLRFEYDELNRLTIIGLVIESK